MNVCSPRNPNICVDCEALTLADSPSALPGQTEAESALQESAGHVEHTAIGAAFPAP